MLPIMFRIYRKTIYPRWHINCVNFPEKENQTPSKSKALVLCQATHNKNHSDENHKKQQHADKQENRYWNDPQFHFNCFKASVFETAGWLGTAALYFNYHFKHLNGFLEHEKSNSSCLFSNIVLAMPRRHSEDEKPPSAIPHSILASQIISDSERKNVSSDVNILESIKTLTKQYAAAVDNSIGIRNINRNDKKAFRSFQSSARHGSSVGFYNLGLCYHLGKGTKVNLNMAAFCYKKAAVKGHGLASFNLATFFSKGLGGLPVDTKIAKELLAEAAEKEVPEAQLYFGISFLEERRWSEAVRIFSSLAKKNLCDAQYYLGLCYESGLGIERNEKLAVELFKKSADQGNKAARDRLNKRENNKGVQHSLTKPAVVTSIEHSNNLHVSSSVPELSSIVKKSDRSVVKFPILSYLDLFTPILLVKNNKSKESDSFSPVEKKIGQECSSTFLSFKSFPLVVMQVKTKL